MNRLRRDEHYEVDEKKRTVAINETGIDAVEDWLGIHNLYESANTADFVSEQRHQGEGTVQAGPRLRGDRGRSPHCRRAHRAHLDRPPLQRGLHQAIEAKERVQIRDEYQTLATITLQNYFRMYEKLAGMTGTALTEASEFQKIYGLGVVPIPTNMPMIRGDQRDLIYRTEEAKFEAIVEDVAERHEKGQPVLIGTASVAKSEICPVC